VSKSSRRRSPQQRPAQPRPAKSGSPKASSGGGAPQSTSPLAKTIAVRSAPALLWLHSLPRWALMVALLVMLVAGLLIPGIIGAALLLILAAMTAWLLILSWPLLDTKGRFLRLMVPLALTAVAILGLTS
jgi:hypothetical protein